MAEPTPPPDPSQVDAELAHNLLLGSTKKLTILPNATPKSASFSIAHEDHTLGNALRYFINKNPDVEFCGYTIPHPSEAFVSVRVQVWDDVDTTAIQVLQKGLNDMIAACDVITEKFEEARDQFNASVETPGGEKMQVDSS